MKGYRQEIEEIYQATLRFFHDEGLRGPSGDFDREGRRTGMDIDGDPERLLDRGRLLSQFEKL